MVAIEAFGPFSRPLRAYLQSTASCTCNDFSQRNRVQEETKGITNKPLQLRHSAFESYFDPRKKNLQSARKSKVEAQKQAAV